MLVISRFIASLIVLVVLTPVLAFAVSLNATRLHLSSYTAGSLELQLAGPADASNHV